MQENIPIEEVFDNLRCSKEGLTTAAAEERLVIFGHNKLEEKKVINVSPLMLTILLRSNQSAYRVLLLILNIFPGK